MFDLISIGDVTIDHFFFIHDATINCKVDHSQCVLQLPYATKIPVNKYVHTTAGNSANIAMGAARLGLKTALISVIGDDSGGREILHRMQKEHVDIKKIIHDPREHTNISAVISFNGDRTILVYHAPHNYDRLKLPNSHAYYLTSLGPVSKQLSSFHNKILHKLNGDKKTLLAFNPGTFQLQLGLNDLKPLLKRTNILFVNKEEAEGLLGVSKSPAETLLQPLRSLNINTVIITDSIRGTWAQDNLQTYYQPIFPVKTVESTGAGDSFACVVISALLKGLALPEALRWGAANSASVVGYVGPQEGLLSLSSIKTMLKKYSAVKTKSSDV